MSSGMNIKQEDHARYQDFINSGGLDKLIDTFVEANTKIMPSKVGIGEIGDALFVMTYLKKLRKGVYESIFESLRNHVPPLVALAGVLGVLGVKEDDIDAAFGMKTSAVSGLYVPNGPV
jgi:hypothetical protein